MLLVGQNGAGFLDLRRNIAPGPVRAQLELDVGRREALQQAMVQVASEKLALPPRRGGLELMP